MANQRDYVAARKVLRDMGDHHVEIQAGESLADVPPDTFEAMLRTGQAVLATEAPVVAPPGDPIASAGETAPPAEPAPSQVDLADSPAGKKTSTKKS